MRHFCLLKGLNSANMKNLHCACAQFLKEKKKQQKNNVCCVRYKEVQVGNDQEKAQSERNSHSKNRGWKNLIDD